MASDSNFQLDNGQLLHKWSFSLWKLSVLAGVFFTALEVKLLIHFKKKSRLEKILEKKNKPGWGLAASNKPYYEKLQGTLAPYST